MPLVGVFGFFLFYVELETVEVDVVAAVQRRLRFRFRRERDEAETRAGPTVGVLVHADELDRAEPAEHGPDVLLGHVGGQTAHEDLEPVVVLKARAAVAVVPVKPRVAAAAPHAVELARLVDAVSG